MPGRVRRPFARASSSRHAGGFRGAATRGCERTRPGGKTRQVEAGAWLTDEALAGRESGTRGGPTSPVWWSRPRGRRIEGGRARRWRTRPSWVRRAHSLAALRTLVRGKSSSMPALPRNHLPILRVRLLGGFDVQVGDRPGPGEIWRRRRKVAAVVKLLALEPSGMQHEQLADQLWPDADPVSARHSLDQALHVARRAIEAGGGPGPWVRTRGGTVVLAPPGQLWVDALAFRAAAHRARATGVWDDYQRAAALYTGELLPEDRYDDWAERRRRGLRAEYLRLLDE